MLVMLHWNPAAVVGGKFLVDRKFHTGMQEYLRTLDMPLLSVHPALADDARNSVMDLVEIPKEELGYDVLTLSNSNPKHMPATERLALEQAVKNSRLVYGVGFGTRAMTAEWGIPTVPFLEYNLQTAMVFAATEASGRAKKAKARLRAAKNYALLVPAMRQARMLHCNGYPMYEQSALFNRNRLLYLDSRMRNDMLISEAELAERLKERSKRRFRLIFSGRFEPAKGALDVVHVAAKCQEQGLNFELKLFGQGSQKQDMAQAVERHQLGARVQISDAIPYPDLVKESRRSDVFICCHIQDDPSCTYLESLGSGLPVVGYRNAMWRSMCKDSNAGLTVPMGSPKALAAQLCQLLRDDKKLDTLSWNARAFASEHTFEKEFQRRTQSLRELYLDSDGATTADVECRLAGNL